MAVLVVLIAATVGLQIAVDTRLRPDWNDMVSAAAGDGLILSGTPDPGWTGLAVRDATVTGAPFLPNAAIAKLTLRRPIWNLFRLTVVSARPVTLIFPDGRQLDLWSRGFRLVLAGHRWRVACAGIGAALHGGGPDDVIGIEELRGDMGDLADGWRLTLAARDMTLPARGTWPNGRLVARVAASLRIGTTAEPGAQAAAPGAPSATLDTVSLHAVELSWGGQSARLSFDGSLDDRGLLSGHGQVVLGPGWAATLKRAHAAGAISAGETEAAIGFLGLLSPDDRAPVAFPVTVAAGRIEVARSTLAVVPSFPVAR